MKKSSWVYFVLKLFQDLQNCITLDNITKKNNIWIKMARKDLNTHIQYLNWIMSKICSLENRIKVEWICAIIMDLLIIKNYTIMTLIRIIQIVVEKIYLMDIQSRFISEIPKNINVVKQANYSQNMNLITRNLSAGVIKELKHK